MSGGADGQQQGLGILILISDETLRTLPPGLMRFLSATDTNWALMMAASVLVTLPSWRGRLKIGFTGAADEKRASGGAAGLESG